MIPRSWSHFCSNIQLTRRYLHFSYRDFQVLRIGLEKKHMDLPRIVPKSNILFTLHRSWYESWHMHPASITCEHDASRLEGNKEAESKNEQERS